MWTRTYILFCDKTQVQMFYFLILVQLKFIDELKIQENSIFYMKL